MAGWTMGIGPAHGFPKNSVGCPRPFLYGPAHLLLVGPKNWSGRPIGPFGGWDPWHQPSPKTAFLGPFLGCFAHSMVILEALSQGFFSIHSWPISRHFFFEHFITTPHSGQHFGAVHTTTLHPVFGCSSCYCILACVLVWFMLLQSVFWCTYGHPFCHHISVWFMTTFLLFGVTSNLECILV